MLISFIAIQLATNLCSIEMNALSNNCAGRVFAQQVVFIMIERYNGPVISYLE